MAFYTLSEIIFTCIISSLSFSFITVIIVTSIVRNEEMIKWHKFLAKSGYAEYDARTKVWRMLPKNKVFGKKKR